MAELTPEEQDWMELTDSLCMAFFLGSSLERVSFMVRVSKTCSNERAWKIVNRTAKLLEPMVGGSGKVIVEFVSKGDKTIYRLDEAD